jgi:hypothetical protein
VEVPSYNVAPQSGPLVVEKQKWSLLYQSCDFDAACSFAQKLHDVWVSVPGAPMPAMFPISASVPDREEAQRPLLGLDRRPH